MSDEIFARYGADPFDLCRSWLAEAARTEPNDPDAVCLATADARGRPSNRMVLLKDIDGRGFKFHTNEESRKGRDMSENPYAAMCLYWKSLRRQIRIEGDIEAVPDSEADAYFATRSAERQIGAWASQQSRPFGALADLEEAVRRREAEFSGAGSIPRPPYWKGFRLVPLSVEFWIANEHRLHTRFAYTRENHEAEWKAGWLYP